MDNLLDLRIPSETGAARRARDALAGVVGEFDAYVRDSLTLLVSELVSSSVRRMGPGNEKAIAVRALAGPGVVRVEVRDSGRTIPPIVPRLRPSGWSILHDPGLVGVPGGWGLAIVNSVADRWGIIADRGTEVWFELDVPGR